MTDDHHHHVPSAHRHDHRAHGHAGHHHGGVSGAHDHSHELRGKSKRRLEAQEGVTLIHDIHVWTLSLGTEALTAHVLADPDYEGDLDPLLRRLRRIVSEDFGIGHITIQLEQSLEGCTENHHVDHLHAHVKPKKGPRRIFGDGHE